MYLAVFKLNQEKEVKERASFQGADSQRHILFLILIKHLIVSVMNEIQMLGLLMNRLRVTVISVSLAHATW